VKSAIKVRTWNEKQPDLWNMAELRACSRSTKPLTSCTSAMSQDSQVLVCSIEIYNGTSIYRRTRGVATYVRHNKLSRFFPCISLFPTIATHKWCYIPHHTNRHLLILIRIPAVTRGCTHGGMPSRGVQSRNVGWFFLRLQFLRYAFLRGSKQKRWMIFVCS